jgi:translation initiation factor 1
MDLKDQLKSLFPDHTDPQEEAAPASPGRELWLQDDPIICRYEKRRGKPVTVLEGYTGSDADFKQLARELKKFLGVGGGWKNEQIVLQGDYRDRIMAFLKDRGFTVKRVGG